MGPGDIAATLIPVSDVATDVALSPGDIAATLMPVSNVATDVAKCLADIGPIVKCQVVGPVSLAK